jgi:hypothetical protein
MIQRRESFLRLDATDTVRRDLVECGMADKARSVTAWSEWYDKVTLTRWRIVRWSEVR